MSSAVASGFAFNRVYCIVPEPMHAKVTALLQEVLNSLAGMVVPLVAAIASRRPELDSHARSALSVVTGPGLVVIATKLPDALPSQRHAYTCLVVTSPPSNPLWL